MRIGDLFAAILAIDIGADIVHRSRAEQRDHRDNVAELAGLHISQRAAHPLALHLKDAGDVARAQQRIRVGVIQWDPVGIEGDALGAFDPAERAVEHRQGREPKDIQLEQTDGLDVLHAELGDEPIPVGCRS